MNDASYSDLCQIIFSALSQCKPNEFNTARLLTKSLYFYYKINSTNKTWCLIDELKKRQGAFSIWVTNDFWNEWFKTELSETVDTFTNKEDFYFNVILSLASIMRELTIEGVFVYKCLYEEIGRKYIIDVRSLLKLGNLIKRVKCHFDKASKKTYELILN